MKSRKPKKWNVFLLSLALCLGLLPVTALAAGAPNGQVIYIGNENVTSGGYWTTDNDGNVTAFTGEGTPADYFIHYDAENNILTLHNATIKKGLDYSESIEGGTYIYGSAIGVFNQSGNAELTIKLEDTNTIAEVGNGIYVLATTGSSNLTIMGDGSLDASVSENGIWVQGNSSNAALSIMNAKVTATVVDSGGRTGVRVQSEKNLPASLTVDGGSLAATGSDATYAGIQMLFGSDTGSGTPNLTVSNNAIVRANGGISDNSSADIQIGADSSGIVFDGKNGTVYGDVTLQEDITIGEGESLTIGDGASLTVPDGMTLTNNGTVTTTDDGSLTNNGTINNSGTLPDSIEGSQPPKIITTSLPNGKVDMNYSQALEATGDATITWSVTSGTLPAGLTLDSSTGTITGTPTTTGSYNFTVTASNNSGSDIKEYTLTIDPKPTVPVTGVTLEPDKLDLFTGESKPLTTKVEPETATDKSVTWESSDTTVATVQDGTVTAVKAGEATITVTTQDGGKTDTCTVTDKTYKISANVTALDFGNAYTGYAQPAAKTVTITNDGNQDVTVTLPTSINYIITAGEGFTDSTATLAPNGTAVFTVQPKAGLAVGTYSENITVTGTNNATLSITASFTVKQYSSGGGGGTPTKTPSQQAVDKIESAKEGSTVEVTLRTGQTTLDKEVFEELAGRDVTLEISVPGGVTWTVNGQDIPADAAFSGADSLHAVCAFFFSTIFSEIRHPFLASSGEYRRFFFAAVQRIGWKTSVFGKIREFSRKNCRFRPRCRSPPPRV